MVGTTAALRTLVVIVAPGGCVCSFDAAAQKWKTRPAMAGSCRPCTCLGMIGVASAGAALFGLRVPARSRLTGYSWVSVAVLELGSGRTRGHSVVGGSPR